MDPIGHVDVFGTKRNYVTARDVIYNNCCKEVLDNRGAQLHWSILIVNINANDSL